MKIKHPGTQKGNMKSTKAKQMGGRGERDGWERYEGERYEGERLQTARTNKQ